MAGRPDRDAAVGPTCVWSQRLTAIDRGGLALAEFGGSVCGTLAAQAAVQAGAGAAASSASVVGIEAGLLHQAGSTLPDRGIHVLRHAERHRSRAADALMAVIAGRAL